MERSVRRKVNAVTIVVAGVVVAAVATWGASRGEPPDDGLSPWQVGGIAGGTALLAAAVTTWAARRAGREQVSPMVAAQAGIGGPADMGAEVRMDHAKLAALATISSTPPRDLTPAQGGIVQDEKVDIRHTVAWLYDAAARGAIAFDQQAGEPEALRVRRTARGDADTAAILDLAFDGRDEVLLGRHDPAFAEAWKRLGETLKEWRRTSGLWVPRTGTLDGATGCGGCLLGLFGCVAAYLGGLWVAEQDGWLALAVGGALVAGWALARSVTRYEREVRTPQGTDAWLRVEGFRRYLAAAGASDAEEAHRSGTLGSYTAWAIALGQAGPWSRAVAAASLPGTDTDTDTEAGDGAWTGTGDPDVFRSLAQAVLLTTMAPGSRAADDDAG